MKTFKNLAVVVMTIILASCGGTKKNDTFDVAVDNTVISGKLSSYFSLVDKTYKYYTDGLIDKVNVELKCIAPLPENLKAYIAVEVLDEQGSIISAKKPDAWSFNDFEILRQASAGQIVTLKIENYDQVKDETPAKIRLSSIVEEDEEEDNSSRSLRRNDSSSTDDTDVSIDDVKSLNTLLDSDNEEEDDNTDDNKISSSSNEDWDELLDSYEQYVDKYISYLKKASKGDLSAISEYPSLMEKAQEFDNKIKNVENDMSVSQWARYNKISMKMLEAAQNMNE